MWSTKKNPHSLNDHCIVFKTLYDQKVRPGRRGFADWKQIFTNPPNFTFAINHIDISSYFRLYLGSVWNFPGLLDCDKLSYY